MIKTRGKTNKKKGTRARGFFASADELRRAGKLEESVPLYRKAAAADPLWGAPCNDLGVVLRKLGRFEEALEAYRDAAKRDPKVPSVHSNLGGALMAVNRFEEAEAAHQKAIALAPGDPQASYQLGLLYKEMERPDLARDAFERCLEMDPDNAYYQWERTFSILKLGDFETGWPAYECRFRRGKIPVRSYPQPRWDGGDLSGKTVLLYPEQGFGDQIQFARFVPELASRGARVVLESGPELQRLLSSLPGLTQCIPLKQPFSEFDVHAPLLSLPLLLRTTLDTLPARVPYLTPPERAEAPEIAAAEGLRVGFVWAGSPTHANDRRRSIPIDLLAELFDIPGVSFFSLQMGKQAEQLSNRLIPENVGFLTSEIKDFADSAALISQLDLILTVDTSMAHLAGALGLRTWVLLAFSGDWRWLMEREDSPWYPSARLFRQPQAGDWTSVIATVTGALETLRDEVTSQPRPAQQPPSPPQPRPAVPRPEPSPSRRAALPPGFERNFIVMGMPRSGTSWVQSLLDAHPAIHCRSEDRFQTILKRTKAFLDACNKDLESAAKVGSDAAPAPFDQEDLREIAKTIMRRALHKGLQKPGIEHAGTRDNSLFFVDTRFFSDLLAGIRMIYVVRDPRDVAVSLWFHNKRIDPSFPASGESLKAWVAQAAQSWHDRVAYGQKLAQSLGDRFHLVRYEDLHGDPRQSTAVLFDFLGAEGSGDTVAESCAAAAFKRRSGGRKPGQADPQSFFRNGLPGDWRNHLDAEAEASVVEKAGSLLQPFGYA